MRTRFMNKNFLHHLKLLSKSEPKWLKDLLPLRSKERMKDKLLSNMLLTESSKWKLMSWGKRKPISWSPVVKSRERSNWWIRRLKSSNQLSKSKFMLSCGCLIKRRKFKENKEKLKTNEPRFRKLSISWPGKLTQELKLPPLKKIKLFASNICLKLSGPKKLKLIRSRRDKNSFWTEKEIWNWLLIMQQRKNSELFKLDRKNNVIRSSLMLLSNTKQHWLKLKRQKNKREGKKSLNFKSITNKVKTTRLLIKNLSMNLLKQKLRDNIKWEKHSGKEKSKPESTYWKTYISQERKMFCWNNRKNKKWIGLDSTNVNRLKNLLHNRMLNSKQELQKKQPQERIIKWTSWNKWMRKIEFRGHSFKKRCTRKELLSLPNSNTEEKLRVTKLKTLPCWASGNQVLITEKNLILYMNKLAL